MGDHTWGDEIRTHSATEILDTAEAKTILEEESRDLAVIEVSTSIEFDLEVSQFLADYQFHKGGVRANY